MKSKKGKILFLLHAHLPYIHHPDFENFMEERWLFEALTETYIPLIKVFKSLEKANIPFKLTISLSPTLMEMLNLNDLREKYHKHLLKLIELTEKEIIRTKFEDPRKYELAQHYRRELMEDMEIFSEEYHQDILKSFKEFKDKGYIEVITSNGTHGYLPFYRDYPEAIRAQIKSAVLTYKKYFGDRPKGIWLAECAYFKGLDRYLSQEDIRYFFVDTHGFTYADSKPRYDVYRPIITPNKVFVFARDPESSEQIWSAEIGYPGDPRYREFYRDIGYDREDDYIKPYIDPSGIRCNTGIKYHRITDKSLSLDKKEIYDLREAENVVKEHARDYLHKKTLQIRKLSTILDEEEPIIVAPFDAELFGHWWYEGPKFLEELFRQSFENEDLEFSTPSEFLQTVKKVQITYPAESSWGGGGYHDVWLNSKNDWIYKHIHEITERMIEKANTFKFPSNLQKRVLNQMMREVLLAQASDWPFIMTTGTTIEYAKNRVKCHINRFFDLEKMLEKQEINDERLSFYEWVDNIFRNIDYTIFSSDYRTN
ncbi:glycoside hydrolase family 57 protein [Petrotoga olearia]|uniref:Glycoside hydrolase n=2 Tax=Petrotoga olearia TaxID=156203 RepID=A0A2K1P126_9BACT|nr:1,4-alpha-glucan branching protein domain-containing protein [Petrotoga olearia]PNR96495.1 glycoside hydrolase [Petrotoga olearia DSM 13574]RMA76417.1 1,4-alpha-glucan branching enzyme [Petrotoga olearia]